MAVPDKKPKIFGLSALYICKLLTDIDGQAPTYDTAIKIDGVQSMTYEGNFEEVEGRGDEAICEVEYKDEKAAVTFESLYFPMTAAVVINGGEIKDGTDDSEYFEPSPDEIGEYFKVIALTKDCKQQVTLYKVKGRLGVKGFTGGQFVNAAFKGTAVHTQGIIQTKPRRSSLKQSSTAITIV